MWRWLGSLVSPPAAVVLLLLGTVSFVFGASAGPVLLSIVGMGVGFLLVLCAIAMVYLVWLKRVNADIDTDRQDLRRDLEAALEDDED